MHIVQINVIDAKSLQRTLNASPAVLRRRIGDDATLTPTQGKLGRQEDIPAALGMELEPLADQVLAVAVDIGGVPVRLSEFPGAVKDLEAFLV